MLPISTRSVFRNRWWTLAWAAGIVWSAAQFAGSGSAGGGGNAADGTVEDASGAIVNEQQAAQAAAAIARIGS